MSLFIVTVVIINSTTTYIHNTHILCPLYCLYYIFHIVEKNCGRLCDFVLRQAFHGINFANLHVDILHLCFDMNGFANKRSRFGSNYKKCSILTSLYVRMYSTYALHGILAVTTTLAAIQISGSVVGLSREGR